MASLALYRFAPLDQRFARKCFWNLSSSRLQPCSLLRISHLWRHFMGKEGIRVQRTWCIQNVEEMFVIYETNLFYLDWMWFASLRCNGVKIWLEQEPPCEDVKSCAETSKALDMAMLWLLRNLDMFRRWKVLKQTFFLISVGWWEESQSRWIISKSDFCCLKRFRTEASGGALFLASAAWQKWQRQGWWGLESGIDCDYDDIDPLFRDSKWSPSDFAGYSMLVA